MNLLATFVSSGAAAAAVALLLTPGSASRGWVRSHVETVGARRFGTRRWLGWGLPLALAAVTWLSGAGVLVALLVAGLVRAVLAGRRRRRTAARSALAEAAAMEACGVLVEEVRAGRHPVEALASASRVDPTLRRAHDAALAGTDVPDALRATGVGSHLAVAAAWQVAERHGAGLAPALSRVVEQLRADAATARVVASELASARATSRLLVALPVFALVAATISGGRPWEFLVGSGAGRLCLLVGVSLGCAGLRWIDAIGDAAVRPGP